MTAKFNHAIWYKNSLDKLASSFEHNPIYRANQHTQPQAAFSCYKGFGNNSQLSSWHLFLTSCSKAPFL